MGSASAVTLNQANVCTDAILGPLMQGGIPSGFSVGGTGDCTAGTAAEAVTCTVTKDTKTVNAQVLCAR